MTGIREVFRESGLGEVIAALFSLMIRMARARISRARVGLPVVEFMQLLAKIR